MRQYAEANEMKELGLLIWIPQFGISVVFPLIGFIMLAVWLQNHFGLGNWVIWIGVLFGLITAAVGVRDTVKAMTIMGDRSKKKKPPAVSFNDHS